MCTTGVCFNFYRMLVFLLLQGVVCFSMLNAGEAEPSRVGTVADADHDRDSSAANAREDTATPPSTKVAPPAGAFGANTPLRRRAPRRSPRTSTRASGLGDLMLLMFYMFILIGFLCAGLFLFKKFMPGARQMFASPAMEVLGRTHIDPRRYVAMVRVGKRVLILGITPDSLDTLTEITDEAEVTDLLESARPKTEAGLNVFQRLFRRQLTENLARDESIVAETSAKELGSSISDLRAQVKSLREHE